MVKFRKMYPLGAIERGFICPWHPLPAIMLMVLTLVTLWGMYYGYWVNMLSGFAFYFMASLWFVFHRSKFVDGSKLLEIGHSNWPRPKGY